MSIFQVIMLLLAAFFAYRVYQHVQMLEDKAENQQANKDTFSPFDPQQLVKKADDAFLEKDYKRALALLIEADTKEPNNAEILGKIGYIFTQENNNEEALTYYKKALQIDKNNNFLYNQIASVYRQLKQFDNAKDALKKSIEIDNNCELTYYNYGNLLYDMQNFDDAVKMYEKALGINPNFKEAKQEIESIRKKLENT